MELNGKRKKKYSNGKQVDRVVSHHETMEERMTYKGHFSFGKGMGEEMDLEGRRGGSWEKELEKRGEERRDGNGK